MCISFAHRCDSPWNSMCKHKFVNSQACQCRLARSVFTFAARASHINSDCSACSAMAEGSQLRSSCPVKFALHLPFPRAALFRYKDCEMMLVSQELFPSLASLGRNKLLLNAVRKENAADEGSASSTPCDGMPDTAMGMLHMIVVPKPYG